MPGRIAGSFLGGAYTLAAAALVSRVLGAVYRILLYSVLQREGMGLLQMASPVYFLALTLSTAGISTATARLVAEREAKGDPHEADAVFRTSLWLLGVLGFVLSVLLFGSSRFIALRLAKDPRSAFSIAAFAPGLFFESVTSAYKGLFLGQQRMGPPAVSQVIEQIVRTGTAFLLVFSLLPRGIEFASAGAAFGTVTGSVAALVYLLWVHSSHKTTRTEGRPRGQTAHPVRPVIKEIAKIAAPISLVTGMLGVTRLINLTVVPARLQALGFSFREATSLYGQLTGGAMPLITLPTVITGALQLSLIPAVTRAQATRDVRHARALISTALRISITLMFPAAVAFRVLSREIPTFLYKDPGIGALLAVMSSTPLLLSLQQTTSGALQGLGRFTIAMRNLLLGAGAQVFVTYTLTGEPAFGILGAAYGTIAALLVTTGLNITALALEMSDILYAWGVVVKPALAACFMGIAVRCSYDSIAGATHLQSVALLGATGFGLLVYLLVLVVAGQWRKRE